MGETRWGGSVWPIAGSECSLKHGLELANQNGQTLQPAAEGLGQADRSPWRNKDILLDLGGLELQNGSTLPRSTAEG